MFDGILPRDAQAFYDPPVITQTSVPNAGSVQVVGPDLRRVILIIAGQQGNNLQVQPDAVPSATSGMSLSNTAPQIVLFWADHGILVQRAWFAFNSSAVPVNCTTIEILLTKDPDVVGFADAVRRPSGSLAQVFIPPQGIRPAQGMRRVPRQWRQVSPHVLAALRQRAPRIFGEE